jgi:hypothetical protein
MKIAFQQEYAALKLIKIGPKSTEKYAKTYLRRVILCVHDILNVTCIATLIISLETESYKIKLGLS